MRKILSGLVVLFLMGSCLTESRISRNCDKFVKVCGATTSGTVYKDTIIYIHDSIPVPLPPDTIEIKGDVQIINGEANFKKVCLDGNLVTTCVEITNGKLHVKSFLNKKSIQSVVNMTITIPNAIRETSNNTIVPVKYIPKAYKWSFWIVIGELVGIILIVLNKFKIFSPMNLLTRLFKK